MNSKTIIFKTILSALTIIIFAGLGSKANGYNDLIKRNKSDTAVKFLIAPLSLTVVQNRPLKGFYFFYDARKNRYFDKFLSGNPEGSDEFDAIVSEPKTIKKTLRATDPTRLAPSKIGIDHRGPVTRLELRKLAKANSSDIIIVFRREIWIDAPTAIPAELFLQPARMLSKETGKLNLEIHNYALIYLTRQDKILAVSPSKNTINVPSQDTKAQLKNIVRMGLKNLAEEARSTIRAQRKIETKSY